MTQAYQERLKNASHKTFPADGRPIFYVCSYGGSGSTMLAKFLGQYGTAYHIHSRKPPQQLTYPIDARFIDNFSDVPVPESELARCHVIYIFKNPTQSQISVYGPHHRVHLEYPDPDNHELYPPSLREYALGGKNTLSYGQHYNNYMCAADRNYKIIGVNYHKLWDAGVVHELFCALKLPARGINRFPKKRETKRDPDAQIVAALNQMNAGLIGLINAAPALQYY